MAKPSLASQAFFNVEGPIAIAHRGGDGAGWDKRNTLAAFRSAYVLGYRYFETDVVRAKSGEVIIAHGAKTPLTAKLRGTFSYHTLQNLNYDEIRQRLKVSGEPIPLLEEVLESFPDVRFLIDPKTDEVVEALAQLIKTRQNYKRVVIGSFYYHRVQRLAQIVGTDKLLTALIVSRANALLRLSAVWFRRLLRKSGYYHPPQIDIYQLPYWFITRGMVSEAHREGRKVVAWTVNKPKSIKRMLQLGADGITSDRPQLLKSTLQEENHKS